MVKENSKSAGIDKEIALKHYSSIAEKIIEGLLESGFLVTKNVRGYWELQLAHYPSKETMIEAIALAILKNLTYGNLGTITMRDNKGKIVAKLYILPDGTIADDSWLNQ